MVLDACPLQKTDVGECVRLLFRVEGDVQRRHAEIICHGSDMCWSLMTRGLSEHAAQVWHHIRV